MRNLVPIVLLPLALNLRSYKAGSLYRLPARVPHFQATGAAGAVVQIESIGPTSTDFIGESS